MAACIHPSPSAFLSYRLFNHGSTSTCSCFSRSSTYIVHRSCGLLQINRTDGSRSKYFRLRASSDDQTRRELWKRELEGSQVNFDEFDEESLREDIEKLNRQREIEKLKSSKYRQSSEVEEKSNLREWVDRLLVADFFFILLALAWLLVAVGLKWGADDSRAIDAWLFLWNPVFQPAIGILMAGALLTSMIGKNSTGKS